MKRKLLVLAIALALIVGLVPVTGIQASSYYEEYMNTCKEHPLLEVTIKVGEKLYPGDLEDIIYNEHDISTGLSDENNLINDDNAVSVTHDDEYGSGIRYLTGKKSGVAYLIDTFEQVTITDSDGKKYKVDLTVKINVVKKSGSNIGSTGDGTYFQLTDGGKAIKATIPGVSGSATYKSSNKKVFKVSKKGNLTPVAPGVATLTVKSGGNTYKAEVRVINKGLKYSGTSITGIGKCKDKKIVIGRYTEDGKMAINTIGEGAFKGSKITSVSIPSTVNTIKENAFDKCKSLKSITIPDGVKKVYCDFKGTGITEVTFPSSVTDVEAPLANNVKTINLTTLDQFEAFCNYGTIDEAYRTVITYNNKEYHTLTGGLPEYTPYLMGYKSEERLSDKQKAELTVLRAVDFRPDQDSFNVKLFKADLVVTSLLSKVSYNMKTTREYGGKNFSDTVYALIGGVNRKDGCGFVCYEYATTTDRIFKLFGLPSNVVIRMDIDHAWQEVRLSDGNWYKKDNVEKRYADVCSHLDDAIAEIGGISSVISYIINVNNYGGNPNGLYYITDTYNWQDDDELGFETENEYFDYVKLILKKYVVGDCDNTCSNFPEKSSIMGKGDTF